MGRLTTIWVCWWAFATALSSLVPIPDNGTASRIKPLIFSIVCLAVGTAFLAWRKGRNVLVWTGVAPISLGAGGMLLALLPNRRHEPWKAGDRQGRFWEDWGCLRSQPGNSIGLVLLAGFLLVFALVFGFIRHDHELASQARVFDPLLGQFRRELAEAQPGAPPVRAGKILPLSTNTGQVELFFWDFLPENLRARTPEDVRILVEMRYWRELIGVYVAKGGKGPDGGNAYAHRAKVRVVDRDTRRLVAEQDFEGKGLPSEVSDHFDREGSTVMSGEIVRFLEGLFEK